MRHKGCGGELSWKYDLPPYEYKHEDGTVEYIPPLCCIGCGKEISGDPEVELGDDD